jgi:hypothetical protein
MGEDSENQKAPEVVLIKSEIEAAAARVAERAMNDSWQGIFAFAGDVFGGLVGDRIKQWRTRNLVTALAKTKDHLEANGVAIQNAKALPMGELYLIFESASKTDDPDLTQMWAALLSNGMNPHKDTFIDPSFPRLLSNLSGLDARILHYMREYERLGKSRVDQVTPLIKGLGRRWQTDDPDVVVARVKVDVINQTFFDKVQAMHDEFTTQWSETNIAYSLTHLLRLGLLSSGSGIGDESDLVSAEIRYEEISVDTRGLRRELSQIWERFDLLNENERMLPTMHVSAEWAGPSPLPRYEITGYARRLLNACS